MQEYIDEYQIINHNFSQIISESLKGENLQVHAKAASFIDDFQLWLELLSDSYELVLYKEALSEYRTMLLFWCMGLYKHAFISLRNYFEAILFGVQLSTNELNYRLWKSGALDLYWSQITNENEGIFSIKFVGAFSPLFCEESLGMRKIAVETYRECSEFIHNNYGATISLPNATQFDQNVFSLIGDKVESMNQVSMFVLTMRYMEKIREKGKVSDFEEPIMDSIGYLACVQEIYR
ncbi:MAG: hypothetical protein ACLRT5_10135 [Lachnospiraceae bacterium]